MRSLGQHTGTHASKASQQAVAPNACMLRRRIRVRAAECITFDVGSPFETRRLRTLTQSLQLDGLPAPSSGSPDRRAAAAAAAAAAALAAAGLSDVEATHATTTSESDSEEESQMISKEFKDCRCCQDVLDVITDELSHMTPHNTVTALGRLATLSKRLPSAERALVLRSEPFVNMLKLLARQLPGMNPFQLVNALYSAAVMKAPLAKVPQLLGAIDAAIARLVPDFNDRDVCSALYAYALLEHSKPAHGAGALLLARAQSLLDKGALEARGVSMLLWAIGSLGLRHAGVCAAATRALLAGDQALLREMTSQGVANCVWGLAKSTNGSVDAALLDHALHAIGEHGDSCKPQEVLNVLWACARCRHDPGQHWVPLLRYSERHAASLAPADIASLFHALGTFAHAPQEGAAAALLLRARELLHRMQPLEACSLYRGLGLCGQVHNEVWEALTLNVVPHAWQSGQLAASTMRMAFQGCLAGVVLGADARLPNDVATALKAAWDEGLAARPRCLPAGSSGRRNALTGEVHALLEELGVRHDVDVPTTDGLSVADVQLRASGGRWVALQVAGEHEYASNTGQKLGPAMLHQALLEKGGYEVRWLSVHDITGKPQSRRLLYMVELLRGIGVGVSKQAVLLAEERAEGRGGSGGAAGGKRGGGGRGGSRSGGFEGGVVNAREAELLFDDPKVSGGRGGRRGKGGSRRH